MLDIAYGLIGEATSNSLLMFCFCNLIIVMILTGSSSPGSMDSQDNSFTTSVSFDTCSLASHDHDSGDDDDDEEEMIVVDLSSAQDESLTDASSISGEYEDKESSHCFDDDDEEEEEDKEDDESNEADVEEEEEDNDDLRKRAEDFIARINNEWRHEKLRALNLVY